MIPASGWVEGFVRPVDLEELTTRLDPWEEVEQGLYRREETITRASCRVWVYVYNRPLPPAAAVPWTAGTAAGGRRPDDWRVERAVVASHSPSETKGDA